MSRQPALESRTHWKEVLLLHRTHGRGQEGGGCMESNCSCESTSYLHMSIFRLGLTFNRLTNKKSNRFVSSAFMSCCVHCAYQLGDIPALLIAPKSGFQQEEILHAPFWFGRLLRSGVNMILIQSSENAMERREALSCCLNETSCRRRGVCSCNSEPEEPSYFLSKACLSSKHTPSPSPKARRP